MFSSLHAENYLNPTSHNCECQRNPPKAFIVLRILFAGRSSRSSLPIRVCRTYPKPTSHNCKSQITTHQRSFVDPAIFICARFVYQSFIISSSSAIFLSRVIFSQLKVDPRFIRSQARSLRAFSCLKKKVSKNFSRGRSRQISRWTGWCRYPGAEKFSIARGEPFAARMRQTRCPRRGRDNLPSLTGPRSSAR